MRDSAKLIYGETMVGNEAARSIEALSDVRGQSQLELAGTLVVSGFDALNQLSWSSISQLSIVTHRVFGDYPDGRKGAKNIIPWNIPHYEWGHYLNWCAGYPVNIVGIVDAAFKASLADALERQGEDFLRELAISPYTTYQSRLDSELFWWSHGGQGGCLDNDRYGTFGGCLDREPNW